MNCVNCGAALKPDAARCLKCGSVVDRPAPPPPPSASPSPSPYHQPAAAPPYAAPAPQAYAPPPPQVVYVQYPDATPQKSKIAAGLLGLFVGAWGIHNFYLGNVARGVIQLIISLTCYGLFITWPWAFIEAILILAGGITRDGRGRPLRD